MPNLGGYQLIDCSSVTLTVTDGASNAVTVTNAELANQFRSAKQILMTGCNVVVNGVKTTVDSPVYSSSHTGAHDGTSHYAIIHPIRVVIATDEDKVIFTPLAVLM